MQLNIVKSCVNTSSFFLQEGLDARVFSMHNLIVRPTELTIAKCLMPCSWRKRAIFQKSPSEEEKYVALTVSICKSAYTCTTADLFLTIFFIIRGRRSRRTPIIINLLYNVNGPFGQKQKILYVFFLLYFFLCSGSDNTNFVALFWRHWLFWLFFLFFCISAIVD